MNRYGKGPGIINRRRAYRVEAKCQTEMGFYARDVWEAEDLFNDFTAAVEDRFPGIVLEITDIYEEE